MLTMHASREYMQFFNTKKKTFFRKVSFDGQISSSYTGTKGDVMNRTSYSAKMHSMNSKT